MAEQESKSVKPRLATLHENEEAHDSHGFAGAFHKSKSQVNLAEQLSETRLIHALSPLPSDLRPTVPEPVPGSPRASEAAQPVTGPVFNMASIFARQGISAIVDDSFTRCFQSKESRRWNWNCYLFPAYCLGVVFRYCILFPLRLAALLAGLIVFLVGFGAVKLLGTCLPQQRIERKLIQFLCSVFVLSWSGVVLIHGMRPQPKKGQPQAGVFVANHTSMIDFIILQQSNCYAVVGQAHKGWVSFFQKHVLSCLQCVWFNRGESSNRAVVAKTLRDHVQDPHRHPLLVFPEGTCVNNEYIVQFKKGVFELDVPICPIAIKYNKVFVDAFWNSRRQSFAQHLLRLMTSWCVVCEVWYLDPVSRKEGETAVEFAKRVQIMIAKQAGLKAVDWDGYMKYWKPSQRFINARQKAAADQLIATLRLRDKSHVLPPAVPTPPGHPSRTANVRKRPPALRRANTSMS